MSDEQNLRNDPEDENDLEFVEKTSEEYLEDKIVSIMMRLDKSTVFRRELAEYV